MTGLVVFVQHFRLHASISLGTADNYSLINKVCDLGAYTDRNVLAYANLILKAEGEEGIFASSLNVPQAKDNLLQIF